MNAAAITSRAWATGDSFRQLSDYVIGETGLVYYATRSEELAANVARRLDSLGIADCGEYLRLLRSGPAGDRELDFLIEHLTIGETHFFRQRELFDALRQTVLPDLVERNAASRRLRIWSAGCSIGAEPYSVAILLERDFGARLRDWDVAILGTDINRRFLARAGKGEFDDWPLRTLGAEERTQCFDRQGRHWKIKPQFTRGVSFQYHNLASHPFPSLLHNLFACDLILCRNVMIYFDPQVIRGTIARFHECLADGGWLVVGHAEHNADWLGAFQPVTSGDITIYRKAPDARTRGELCALEPRPRAVVAATDNRPGPHFCAPPAETRVSAKRVRSAPPAPIDEWTRSLRRARELADRGALAEAGALCQQCIDAHKLRPAPHFYLGLILEQMGRHDEAERCLRRAIYLDRAYLLAHYYLGLLLQKRGRRAQAGRSFRNAAKLLSRKADDDAIADWEGLTVSDLVKLTGAHLAALEDA